ncbi:MAG: histidine phosphatase family protein [Anaerolinea sp.]|nr:histidine phosphatase family protein [Anaerolinea sp.]
MSLVYLLRHGENDVMARRLAGRLPGTHLNRRGQEQAQQVAEKLADAPIRAIFSSPLERAVETAMPLSERLGVPVQVLDGLNEVDYGTWQGRSYRQLERLKLWRQLRVAPSRVRFPGGETLMEVQERAVMAVQWAMTQVGADEGVACFTHGDVVRLVTTWALGLPFDSFRLFQVDTASLTILAFGEGRLQQVRCVNQNLAGDETKTRPKARGLDR